MNSFAYSMKNTPLLTFLESKKDIGLLGLIFNSKKGKILLVLKALGIHDNINANKSYLV